MSITIQEALKKHSLWACDMENGERFSLKNLRNANLRIADLVDADLVDADLSDADLSGANLYNADLCNADLRNADLRNADLSGADLSGADLSGADLDFSELNLSCNGLDFKIDERLAKQIAYHLVSLMDYSGIPLPDDLRGFANESHVIAAHSMPKLEIKEEKK